MIGFIFSFEGLNIDSIGRYLITSAIQAEHPVKNGSTINEWQEYDTCRFDD